MELLDDVKRNQRQTCSGKPSYNLFDLRLLFCNKKVEQKRLTIPLSKKPINQSLSKLYLQPLMNVYSSLLTLYCLGYIRKSFKRKSLVSQYAQTNYNIKLFPKCVKNVFDGILALGADNCVKQGLMNDIYFSILKENPLFSKYSHFPLVVG